MKNALLVVLAICTAQAFADSPESARPSIWSRPENASAGTALITPFIGIAAMKLTGGGTTTQSDTGLSIGAQAEFGQGLISFQTGLLYDEFGAKEDSVTFTLSYLHIPLMAKFNFMGNAEQTVYAKVGLMPGILVSNTAKADDGSTATLNNVSSFDLPVVIGVGGALPISSYGSLVIEANFVRGLTAVNSSGDSHIYNQGFIVGAGYSIPL